MALIRKLAIRNLWTDKFATICAILGVALGTATVNVVLILDESTQRVEAKMMARNPHLRASLEETVGLQGYLPGGTPSIQHDTDEETHEDYEIMRAAIRVGALGAFIVGALIVFFTFSVLVERRKRELALLRSLGTTPRQIVGILFLEASIIGITGAILGLFAAMPLSAIAAIKGITTTGRSILTGLWFPYQTMLIVSLIGASCALLGIIRPAIAAKKLDVTRTLMPRFLSDRARLYKGVASNVSLLAIPSTVLSYVLLRPFLRSTLSSITFFLLELLVLGIGLLACLWFVPSVIRLVGSAFSKLTPHDSHAHRFLVIRRIQTHGRDVSWSIAGLMMVFGMLLGLHLMTRALKSEVHNWSTWAALPYTFIYAAPPFDPAEHLLPKPPRGVPLARYSGRTPWPNSVLAISQTDLLGLAQSTGRTDLQDLAATFESGTTILSSMMAKRYNLERGDFLEVQSRDQTKRFEVIAVTDDLGYVPQVGPYRNGRTYAIIESRDYELIRPYARRIGHALVIADPKLKLQNSPVWNRALRQIADYDDVFVIRGRAFAEERIRETDRDFLIFDWLLVLTTILAAIGIANQMMLSTHTRKRELALYRVLGMTKNDIQKMFIFEGIFVGGIGAVFALILGIPLGYTAVETLGVLSAFEMTFSFPWHWGLWTFIGSALVATVSAFYPAKKAGEHRHLEAIHYE